MAKEEGEEGVGEEEEEVEEEEEEEEEEEMEIEEDKNTTSFDQQCTPNVDQSFKHMLAVHLRPVMAVHTLSHRSISLSTLIIIICSILYLVSICILVYYT